MQELLPVPRFVTVANLIDIFNALGLEHSRDQTILEFMFEVTCEQNQLAIVPLFAQTVFSWDAFRNSFKHHFFRILKIVHNYNQANNSAHGIEPRFPDQGLQKENTQLIYYQLENGLIAFRHRDMSQDEHSYQSGIFLTLVEWFLGTPTGEQRVKHTHHHQYIPTLTLPGCSDHTTAAGYNASPEPHAPKKQTKSTVESAFMSFCQQYFFRDPILAIQTEKCYEILKGIPQEPFEVLANSSDKWAEFLLNAYAFRTIVFAEETINLFLFGASRSHEFFLFVLSMFQTLKAKVPTDLRAAEGGVDQEHKEVGVEKSGSSKTPSNHATTALKQDDPLDPPEEKKSGDCHSNQRMAGDAAVCRWFWCSDLKPDCALAVLPKHQMHAMCSKCRLIITAGVAVAHIYGRTRTARKLTRLLLKNNHCSTHRFSIYVTRRRCVLVKTDDWYRVSQHVFNAIHRWGQAASHGCLALFDAIEHVKRVFGFPMGETTSDEVAAFLAAAIESNDHHGVLMLLTRGCVKATSTPNELLVDSKKSRYSQLSSGDHSTLLIEPYDNCKQHVDFVQECGDCNHAQILDNRSTHRAQILALWGQVHDAWKSQFLDASKFSTVCVNLLSSFGAAGASMAAHNACCLYELKMKLADRRSSSYLVDVFAHTLCKVSSTHHLKAFADPIMHRFGKTPFKKWFPALVHLCDESVNDVQRSLTPNAKATLPLEMFELCSQWSQGTCECAVYSYIQECAYFVIFSSHKLLNASELPQPLSRLELANELFGVTHYLSPPPPTRNITGGRSPQSQSQPQSQSPLPLPPPPRDWTPKLFQSSCETHSLLAAKLKWSIRYFGVEKTVFEIDLFERLLEFKCEPVACELLAVNAIQEHLRASPSTARWLVAMCAQHQAPVLASAVCKLVGGLAFACLDQFSHSALTCAGIPVLWLLLKPRDAQTLDSPPGYWKHVFRKASLRTCLVLLALGVTDAWSNQKLFDCLCMKNSVVLLSAALLWSLKQQIVASTTEGKDDFHLDLGTVDIEDCKQSFHPQSTYACICQMLSTMIQKYVKDEQLLVTAAPEEQQLLKIVNSWPHRLLRKALPDCLRQDSAVRRWMQQFSFVMQ